MRIAIIDADLIGRNKHRFPNLVCMKLSGYHKELGNEVSLITDYKQLYYDENIWNEYQKAFEEYAKTYKKMEIKPDVANALGIAQAKCFNEDNIKFDKIFISKVFTDTEIDEDFLELDIVEYGGTGFFYDKAPKLPCEIEHHMPDYHLYDEWVFEQLENGGKRIDFKYYLDYSLGFLTRGCFRQCEFCVNKNYKKVEKHSPLTEFFDSTRKKICLLDDNFLGCSYWKKMLLELQNSGKQFQFKQGLDERILTDEKCELLFSSKYDGDYIFAFDNIADKDIVEKKARLIRKYNKNLGQNVKFYVLCGFDRNEKYDLDFWMQDINDTFERVFILSKYNFKPYIMRFNKYKESPLYGTYVNIACWCNQPNLFNNLSYKQFCEKDDLRKSGGKGTSATWRYYEQMITLNPECEKYINIIPKEVREDYTAW